MISLTWSAESERFLLRVDTETAELILDAMERFVRTGRGFVRDMLDGHGTFGLYVSGFVILFVREASGDIRVLRVRQRPR